MKAKNKKRYIFERAVILTITLVFIAGTFTPIVGSQDENLEIGESVEEEIIKLGNEETISKTSSYESNQEIDYLQIKESSLWDKLVTLLKRSLVFIKHPSILNELHKILIKNDIINDETTFYNEIYEKRINYDSLSLHEYYANSSNYPFEKPIKQPIDNANYLFFSKKSFNPWWDFSWLYRKNITINNTKVNDDLFNFPVLIDFDSDSDLSDGSKCQDDGDDIVFTDSFGNKLNHEIEFFNNDTGELIAWVNVTNLSSSDDTILYMYYGNSDASNQENPVGVWDSHYRLVHHLEEVIGNIFDSSAFNNNGIPLNGVTLNAYGKIDGADSFDGIDDYISVNENSTLDGSGTWDELTLEFWLKSNADNQNATIIIGKRESSSSGSYQVGFDSAGNSQLFSALYTSSSYYETSYTDSPSLITGEWNHIISTYKSGLGIFLYINGVLIANNTDSTGYIRDTSIDLYIGARGNDGSPHRFLDGDLDEVRVSNAFRNESWINTEYLNQHDPTSFYSVGAEEVGIPPDEPVVSSPSPANGATTIGLNPTLSIHIVDFQGDDMDINFRTNASGSWMDIGTNSSVSNGTYYCDNTSNMSVYSTVYWWSVNVTDAGSGNWTNRSFWFETGEAPPFEVEFIPPTPDDESVVYARNVLVNVSSDRNLSNCSLILWNTSSNLFTVSINESLWNKWGFKYPVTYVFNLSDVPSNTEVVHRDSVIDPWVALEEKTEHDFFNGVECVRFNSSEKKAYVSVGFNSSNLVYLKFLNVTAVSYDSVSRYYDNRKAVYSLSNDNWGGFSYGNNGAQWQGMINDASDKFQASIHATRMFNIPQSIAINTNYPAWNNMQDELNYSDYSWEPTVHTRTHPCSSSAYNVNGYEWEILGCRDDILENLSGIPFGQYVFEFILSCGYEDNTLKSVSDGEFLFIRDYLGGSDPSSTVYSPWNSNYDFYGPGGFETIGYDQVFQARSPYARYYASDVATLNNAFDTVYNSGGIFYVMFHADKYTNSVIYDTRTGIDGVQGSSFIQHLSYVANRTDVWYVANGWLYSYHMVDDNGSVFLGGLDDSIVIPMSIVNDYENTYAFCTLNDLDYGMTYRYRVIANDTVGSSMVVPDVSDFRSFSVFEPVPIVSSPSPTDGATGIDLSPLLSVYAEHPLGDDIDIIFRTNASGSWLDIGTNSSVSNGTYYCDNTSDISVYNRVYWWSVNVTDAGSGSWTNRSFWFETEGSPPFGVEFIPPTPDDESVVYTRNVLVNVSSDRNLSNCSLLLWNTSGNLFTVSINESLWNRWGFMYPVTYVFNLSDVPSNTEVVHRDSVFDPWVALEEKTEHDFFNGVEYVRFNSSEKKAYVSIGFNSSNVVYLKFLNVTSVSYDSVARYYDNRKATFTLSNDNWGAPLSYGGNSGAPWQGMTNDDSDKFQASIHATRLFNIPQSIAINSAVPAAWNNMQDELNYSDYSWEPAVHTRTHYCGGDANEWQILGCRDDILENLSGIPYGQYVFEYILACGTYSSNIGSISDGEFLFLRDYVGGSDPSSTDYSPWNGNYDFYGPGGFETQAYDQVFFTRSPRARYYASDVATLNNAFDTVYNSEGIFYVMYHADYYANSVIYDTRPGIDGVQGSSFIQHLSYVANRTDVWYVANGWLYSYHMVDDNVSVFAGGEDDSVVIPMSIVNDDENTYAFCTLNNLDYGMTYRYRVIANDTVGGSMVAPDVPEFRSFSVVEPVPMVSSSSPTDGATGVDLSPLLSVYAEHPLGNNIDITFKTNASGSWLDIGTNSSVSNGTYYCNNTSDISVYNRVYWWSVNVSDAGGNWTNQTFSFSTMSEPVGWWNSEWIYRKMIVIEHENVSADLTNFPVLIGFNSDSDLDAHAQDDGDDIVFTDYFGDVLYHEIELFNGSSGELVCWVNVTSLSSSEDTILYIYYGNSSCGSQENPENVWSDGYLMVHHLNEITGTHYDSTSYNNDGTANGGLNQDVTGKIDGADSFDGGNDNINVGTSPLYEESSTVLSVSAWFYVNPTSFNGDLGQVVCTAPGSSPTGGGFWVGVDDRDNTYSPANGMAYNFKTTAGYQRGKTDNDVIPSEGWYHVALVLDGHSSIYVNGQDVTNLVNDDVGDFVSINSDMIIGDDNSNNFPFNGVIDEVRILNGSINASWISTEYNNQLDPDAFYNVGIEETSFDTIPPEITNVQATPSSTSQSGYVNITCDVTDNIGVYTVMVNITGPGGFTPVNTTMTEGSYYYNTSYTIVGTYNFFIWANDISDNLNMSAGHSFSVTSSGAPSIIDNSPDTAGTGDSLIVNATVSDADGVSSVWVEYWFDGGSKTNVSMSNTGGDYWEYDSISIPADSTDDLFYNISAEDIYNVWSHLNDQQVVITDDDLPMISSVLAIPSSTAQGDYVNITSDVTDNIGVGTVKIDITGPVGFTPINVTMNEGSYYYNASYSIVGTYDYFIWANDTIGNSNMSSIEHFTVTNLFSWDVTLNLNESGGSFSYAIFGEAVNASDGPTGSGPSGNDDYDEPLPPSPQQPYISSWFDDNLISPFDTMLKDYRSYPDTYKIWNLSIQWVPTDYISPTTITISWNTALVNASEYNYIGLYDGTGTALLENMLTNNNYTYGSPAMIPQTYKIICSMAPTEYYYSVPLGEEWNLVSMPVNESVHKDNITVNYLGVNYTWQQSVDNGTILGFIYGWNVIGQSYVTSDVFDPGQSYWMYAFSDCTLWITTTTRNNDDYITELLDEWNLVGISFDTSVAKENLTIHYNGTDYTWQQAVDNDTILGFIYGWNVTSQNYVTNDVLIPGVGYWMYAYDFCSLRRS